MLATLLNNKISTAREVPAGLRVIIIIIQVRHRGGQEPYLLDARFIIKADNNNLIPLLGGSDAAADTVLHILLYLMSVFIYIIFIHYGNVPALLWVGHQVFLM